MGLHSFKLYIVYISLSPFFGVHSVTQSYLKSAHLTATSRCILSCLRYRRSASNFSSVLLILSIRTSCSYCSLTGEQNSVSSYIATKLCTGRLRPEVHTLTREQIRPKFLPSISTNICMSNFISIIFLILT